MKKPILTMAAVLMAVVLAICTPGQAKIYNTGINIIPTPAELTVNDTVNLFTINKSTTIGIASQDLKTPAGWKNRLNCPLKNGGS